MADYLASWAREERGQSLPLITALVLMLIIGIGTALVFFVFVAPLVGQEKVYKVFYWTDDIDSVLNGIKTRQPLGSALHAVCGNRVCENGETINSCIQDCFFCNRNGQCESNFGENSDSCSADCPE